MAVSTIGTGGDYATLALWQAARQSSGTSETARLKTAGSHLTQNFGLSDGWGGAVTIEPDVGAHHTGKGGTGVVIDPDTSGVHVFVIQEDTHDVTIRGIEITNSTAGTSDEGIRISPAADGGSSTYTIRECLIYGLKTAAQCDGIYTFQNSAQIVVENCAMWGFSRSAINVQQFAGGTGYEADVTVRNCSLGGASTSCIGITGNSDTGGNEGPHVHVYNSLLWGASTGCITLGTSDDDTIELDVVDCIADDATITSVLADDAIDDAASGQSGCTESATFVAGTPGSGEVGLVSLTGGSEDFHLFDHANNIAIGYCDAANAPASGVDFEGGARPTSGDVDCGADQTPTTSDIDLTPTANESESESDGPVVVLGSVTQDPLPGTVSSVTVDPGIVLGSITQQPLPSTAASSTVEPGVVLGGVAQNPAAGTNVSQTADPAVVLGGIAQTPAASENESVTVAPAVELGDIAQTPTASENDAETADPSISISSGSFTLEPDPGVNVSTTANPTLGHGSVTVTPTANESDSVTIDPSTILGSVSQPPTAGECESVTVEPALHFTSVTVEPGANENESVTVDPSVDLAFGGVEPPEASDLFFPEVANAGDPGDANPADADANPGSPAALTADESRQLGPVPAHLQQVAERSTAQVSAAALFLDLPTWGRRAAEREGRGLYVAVMPQGIPTQRKRFRGGALQMRRVGATPWEFVGMVQGSARWGQCRWPETADGVYPGASSAWWDRDTVLTLEFGNGEAASATEEAVREGANWLLVGSEVIGIATLTPIQTEGQIIYEGRDLLRGLLATAGVAHGTDLEAAGQATEPFVSIDDELAFVPVHPKATLRDYEFRLYDPNHQDLYMLSDIESDPLATEMLSDRPLGVGSVITGIDAHGRLVLTWTPQRSDDSPIFGPGPEAPTEWTVRIYDEGDGSRVADLRQSERTVVFAGDATSGVLTIQIQPIDGGPSTIHAINGIAVPTSTGDPFEPQLPPADDDDAIALGVATGFDGAGGTVPAGAFVGARVMIVQAGTYYQPDGVTEISGAAVGDELVWSGSEWTLVPT